MSSFLLDKRMLTRFLFSLVCISNTSSHLEGNMEDQLAEANRLNDKAEKLFDRILQQQARGMDALHLTGVIDFLWSELKSSREKAGRPKPA